MPAHGVDAEERTHETNDGAAFLNGLRKGMAKSAEYAPGIPEKGVMAPVPSVAKPETWAFGAQQHMADKAGPHLDLRLSDGKTAFSWAVRKGLPSPGQKVLAVRQSDHSPSYLKWSGTIAEGYGKGKVSLKRSGDARVEKASGAKINFALLDSKNPQRYSLIRAPKYGDKRWLLLNTTPTETSRFDVPLGKMPTRDASASGLAQYLDDRYILASKIDGASVIVNLGDKTEVFSHRPSVSGELIDHSFVTGADVHPVPKAFRGTKVRAEVFGIKDGAPIPLAELGGLLNSSPEKAIRQIKDSGVRMYIAPFKVLRHDGKDFDGEPYEKHITVLNRLVRSMPAGWIMPDVARTRDEKKNLLKLVREGKHPLTSEGVVAWPAGESATPEKIKFRDHFQVYIVDVFPMVSNGHTVDLAGGFSYSLAPGGEVAGRVGTGFSMSLRKEMWDDRKNMTGRKVVIRSVGQLPSGAYRAPSFEAFHL